MVGRSVDTPYTPEKCHRRGEGSRGRGRRVAGQYTDVVRRRRRRGTREKTMMRWLCLAATWGLAAGLAVAAEGEGEGTAEASKERIEFKVGQNPVNTYHIAASKPRPES